MRLLVFLGLMGVAGCAVQTSTQSTTSVPAPTQASAPAAAPSGNRLTERQAAQQFVRVVEKMEPIVERACNDLTNNMNCDFRIVVDDRAGQPPNAFQTLDDSGRPVLGFTVPLLLDMRNQDELAFVLGHEAAHHIRGHLARQQQSTAAGAVLGALIGAASGGGQEAVDAGQRLGASIGARRYSKNFELEADQLGAILTQRSGYDPVRGAAYFTRIPDPGNRFLGTHPPNQARIDTVRRAVGR